MKQAWAHNPAVPAPGAPRLLLLLLLLALSGGSLLVEARMAVVVSQGLNTALVRSPFANWTSGTLLMSPVVWTR